MYISPFSILIQGLCPLVFKARGGRRQAAPYDVHLGLITKETLHSIHRQLLP